MKPTKLLSIFRVWLCVYTMAHCVEDRTVLDGFPLGIDCGGVDTNITIEENATIQCVVVTTDGEMLYNESIVWKNRNNSRPIDADKTLNGKIIKVTLIYGNFSETKSYNVTVFEPTRFNCSDTENLSGDRNVKRWEEHDIQCVLRDLPDELNNMINYDEHHKTELNYVMYHDCDGNSTVTVTYNRIWGNYLRERRNITTELAGSYSFVAEYKGRKTPVCRMRLCVGEPPIDRTGKDMSIKSVVQTYKVVLGNDYTFQCEGIANHNSNVLWKKQKNGSWITFCDTYCDDDCDDECTYQYHEAEKVCQRTKETRQKFHAFTSTYTVKNISYDHAGNYSCDVEYDDAVSYFTIIVIRSPTLQLVQVLTPLAALLLIVIMVSICLWRRMDIKYIYYKKFKKFTESEKLVTSLVYADDAFNETNKDEKCNPLLDVRNVLDKENRQYHDPHDGKTLNNYGGPRGEHTANVLDNSNSLTVIVTPNLVQDETAELLQTYEGLRGNVERKLPLIFICEKKVERIIKERAELGQDNDNERYVMFRSFMKRHPVVYWNRNNRKSFKKSLYVVLPKVKSSKVKENYQMAVVEDEEV